MKRMDDFNLPIICPVPTTFACVASNADNTTDDLRAILCATNNKISMLLFDFPTNSPSFVNTLNERCWNRNIKQNHTAYLQRLTQSNGPKWMRTSAVKCANNCDSSMFHFQWILSATHCFTDAHRLQKEKQEKSTIDTQLMRKQQSAQKHKYTKQ